MVRPRKGLLVPEEFVGEGQNETRRKPYFSAFLAAPRSFEPVEAGIGLAILAPVLLPTLLAGRFFRLHACAPPQIVKQTRRKQLSYYRSRARQQRNHEQLSRSLSEVSGSCIIPDHERDRGRFFSGKGGFQNENRDSIFRRGAG